MDGRVAYTCIAPLVSSSDGIHAWMGRPSVMHVERMLMVGALARISLLAVRDGDGAVASLVVALAADARTH